MVYKTDFIIKTTLILRMYLPILKDIDELNKTAGQVGYMRALCLFRHEIVEYHWENTRLKRKNPCLYWVVKSLVILMSF